MTGQSFFFFFIFSNAEMLNSSIIVCRRLVDFDHGLVGL